MQKVTLFFVLGILATIAGSIYAIILIMGNSAQGGLTGIYILLGLIPLLLFLVLDRILAKKFGSQKVNKVQLFILLFIVILWTVRTILNL